jgi:hypothetical protein
VRTIWNTQIHSVGRIQSFSMLKQDIHIVTAGVWRIYFVYLLQRRIRQKYFFKFYPAQLYPQAMGSSVTSGVPFPVPTIVGPWGVLPWLWFLTPLINISCDCRHSIFKQAMTTIFKICTATHTLWSYSYLIWLKWPHKIASLNNLTTDGRKYITVLYHCDRNA